MSLSVPHLISPLTVRGKTYPNRMCSAPSLIGISMGPDGVMLSPDSFELKLSYAKGGMGEVCIGETHVDSLYAPRNHVAMGGKPEYCPFEEFGSPAHNTWRSCAEQMHNNGALIFCQLVHAGAMRTSGGEILDRPVAIGPMGYTRDNGEIVKAMDEDDIEQVCAAFARAARWLKEADFDGVMVHGGHGWLLTQFLSPASNQRTDEYGGSMDKRCSFPVKVIKVIREAVGDDFIIEMRVSGEETGVPDGYGVEQVALLAEKLVGILDIMHFSNGHYNLRYTSRVGGGNAYLPHNCNLEQAVYVKEHVPEMLVNVVGSINNPEECDRLIAEGKIDLISMAKQLHADVNFANKCKAGHADDITRCVRCTYCYPGGVDKEDFRVVLAPKPMPMPEPGSKMSMEPKMTADPNLKGLAAFHSRYAGPVPAIPLCTVNPEYGLTIPEGGWPVVKKSQKVLIVGGGVAGMMAAITASDRFHRVTLVDKSGVLGGQINFTETAAYKEDLWNYRNLLIRRVEKRNIDLRLNTEITPELIEELTPDVILAAVGSVSKALDIPGAERAVHVLDVYTKEFVPGTRAVIIGGGMYACEAAIHLAERGVKVTVLKTRTPDLKDSYPTPATEWKLETMGIPYVEDIDLEEIMEHGVKTSQGFYEADTVVYMAGSRANKELVEKIKTMAGEIPVQAIGDCKSAGNVAAGIRGAYVAAMELC